MVPKDWMARTRMTRRKKEEALVVNSNSKHLDSPRVGILMTMENPTTVQKRNTRKRTIRKKLTTPPKTNPTTTPKSPINPPTTSDTPATRATLSSSSTTIPGHTVPTAK